MPLIYLSILEVPQKPLINCKVKLKLKSTKHCVLDAAGADMLIKILIILFSLQKRQNYVFWL